METIRGSFLEVFCEDFEGKTTQRVNTQTGKTVFLLLKIAPDSLLIGRGVEHTVVATCLSVELASCSTAAQGLRSPKSRRSRANDFLMTF